MKTLLRCLGVLFLICGLILCFGGEKTQEISRPQQAYSYVISEDGEQKLIDSFQLGGSSELEEVGNVTQGLGIFSCVAGGVCLVCSFIPKQQKNEYDY